MIDLPDYSDLHPRKQVTIKLPIDLNIVADVFTALERIANNETPHSGSDFARGFIQALNEGTSTEFLKETKVD